MTCLELNLGPGVYTGGEILRGFVRFEPSKTCSIRGISLKLRCDEEAAFNAPNTSKTVKEFRRIYEDEQFLRFGPTGSESCVLRPGRHEFAFEWTLPTNRRDSGLPLPPSAISSCGSIRHYVKATIRRSSRFSNDLRAVKDFIYMPVSIVTESDEMNAMTVEEHVSFQRRVERSLMQRVFRTRPGTMQINSGIVLECHFPAQGITQKDLPLKLRLYSTTQGFAVHVVELTIELICESHWRAKGFQQVKKEHTILLRRAKVDVTGTRLDFERFLEDIGIVDPVTPSFKSPLVDYEYHLAVKMVVADPSALGQTKTLSMKRLVTLRSPYIWRRPAPGESVEPSWHATKPVAPQPDAPPDYYSIEF